jgi:hypothetical protein
MDTTLFIVKRQELQEALEQRRQSGALKKTSLIEGVAEHFLKQEAFTWARALALEGAGRLVYRWTERFHPKHLFPRLFKSFNS